MRVVESDVVEEPILMVSWHRLCLDRECAGVAVLNARDWDEAQLARLQAVLPSTNYVTAVVRSLEGEQAGAL